MLSCAGVLLIGTLLAGQVTVTETTNRVDFEKYCQSMNGRWYNNDESLAEFWPAFDKNGKGVVSYAEVRIVADGNALEGSWYAGTGSSKWIEAWDAEAKQIRKFGIVSDGTLWQETRTKQGDQWQCAVTLTRPNGDVQKFASVLSMSADGNTHTYTSNDADAAEKRPGVYTRVAK